MDWSQIDPSIMGTLFERGLDPDKRSQLGAHYTDAEKIMKIIEPVIQRPLEAEWADAKANIEQHLARAQASKSASARTRAHNEAANLFRGYLDRLRAFRVLDPACGSGNFLYLALQTLKDLEHRASIEAESLGLPREFPRVGPEQLLGIEINPYAAELARVSVWIGEIQWMQRNGFGIARNPILRPLDTIECRDAILNPDGAEAEWPAADVIIGNPPFLGNKRMIGVLGEDYAARVRKVYKGRVPAGADFVTYWFDKARSGANELRVRRVGLVATNSIRGGENRKVLEGIVEDCAIFDVWGDEPWIVEGAAVRVSLVCFASPDHGPSVRLLNGQPVETIFADLTGRSVDLTLAHRLEENGAVAFQGPVLVGRFDVRGELARAWLSAPVNPQGRPNADVLRPLRNGSDITGRPRGMWVIDFFKRTLEEAALYEAPFAHVAQFVKPVRTQNRRERRARLWWQHGETGDGWRRAVRTMSRYIATSQVSKHRFFVWLHPTIQPHQTIISIARDDDATFGMVQSPLA
jgi:hypothetical protein